MSPWRSAIVPDVSEESIPPARPVIGDAEIDAAVRVLRSGRVVQGPEVAAFEQEFSALVDGRALRRRQLGHLGAAAGPAGAGHRPGRRGHRPVVLVRGDAPTRYGWPAPSPSSPTSTPTPSASTRTRWRRRRAAHRGASCRSTSTGIRPPMDRLMQLAAAARARRGRGRRQAHGAALARPAGGRLRRRRLLQLLPDQEHARPGGRHGHHRRRRRSPAPCGCCATRAWSSAYANEIVGANMRMTDVAAAIGRVQLDAARGLDRAAPGQRQVPGRADHQGRGHAAGRGRRPARLPPVHGAGRRRPGHARSRSWLEARGGQRGLLPDADPPAQAVPGRRRPAGRRDLPETDRAAAEVLSLPVHPSLTPGSWTGSPTRVNAPGGCEPMTATRALRAGLIGLGAMGRNHARVLSGLDGVELVGVVDPAGDPHGRLRGVPVLPTVAELIALGIDYAVVACPTGAARGGRPRAGRGRRRAR